ncbi:hypothetical protein [Leuconostoc lactis]|uniref:hypothetical protein n=1 Tax=Leuconostoc lactis TaxID=1246 RepID=UPI001FCA7B8F|nr:hypothetical protein [Leuconostoc lactis]
MAGAFGNIRHEGGVEMRSGKKPEKMLKRLFKDILLKRYCVRFLWWIRFYSSNSTKMNRRFITVEQIDEQVYKLKKRLVNVINGDTTGISKDVIGKAAIICLC